MLGLLAPDLPVVLWCRGPRWFREPHFEQLLPLVHKLVVDSTRFPDPKAGFELVTEMRGKVRRVADLTWSATHGLARSGGPGVRYTGGTRSREPHSRSAHRLCGARDPRRACTTSRPG